MATKRRTIDSFHDDIPNPLKRQRIDQFKLLFLLFCEDGNIDEVKSYIDQDDGFGFTNNGANVNTAIAKTGKAALHYACENGHSEIAKLLIRHGANLEAIDKDGKTPFFYTCINRRDLVLAKLMVDVTKLLYENGSKTMVRTQNRDGDTVLHRACGGIEEKLDVAKFVIEHDAQLNAKNTEGDTPLHEACRRGYIETIKLLIQHGADPNTKSNDGKTPMDYASGDLQPTIAKIINEAVDKTD